LEKGIFNKAILSAPGQGTGREEKLGEI